MNNQKIILYMRLSLADKGAQTFVVNESDSIEHQREILWSYLNSNPIDPSCEVLELIDDGYTGTDFERPKFQQLLDMVNHLQVKAVIVKDLSRLGRDYLDVGYLTDLVFPSYRVRLIAVNDCYDSLNNSELTAGAEIALKNIANQFYSIDLSKKMKAARAVWLQKGKHMGDIPFGYKRGDSSGQLVIDEEAAKIVRLIFRMALEYLQQGEKISTTKIARKLNEQKIITPSLYRSKRLNQVHIRPIWTASSVRTILTKEIYTGNLVKYLTHRRRVGSHSKKTVPKSEWEIVPNTHEAIVSQEVFDTIQVKIRKETKDSHVSSSRTPVMQSPLQGIMRCGYCGAIMQLHASQTAQYICQSAVYLPADSRCRRVLCNANEIEAIVVTALNQIAAATSERISTVQDNRASTRRQYDILEKKRNKALSDLSKLKRKRQDIFECLVDGKIEPAEFLNQKELLSSKEAELENLSQTLWAEQELLHRQLMEMQSQMQELTEYKPLSKLTKETARKFVNRIAIYPDKSPEITFNFSNAFESK